MLRLIVRADALQPGDVERGSGRVVTRVARLRGLEAVSVTYGGPDRASVVLDASRRVRIERARERLERGRAARLRGRVHYVGGAGRTLCGRRARLTRTEAAVDCAHCAAEVRADGP